MEIIRKSDIKLTRWSGGTTSELFIYPRNAEFRTDSFDLRVSIATVEIDSSVFTPLEGMHRTLMVLDGTLKLDHEDHHSTELKAFDQDSFEGDWITRSEGKVTDFNVMTMQKNRANVEYSKLDQNCAYNFNNSEIDFIHVLKGE
jgi:uncharacterized protein